jgi:hypothetical protein
MMEGLHANSKGVPSLKGSILCVSGEVLSSSKEEKKNHGVLSEMTAAFGSKKVAERKTKQP